MPGMFTSTSTRSGVKRSTTEAALATVDAVSTTKPS